MLTDSVDQKFRKHPKGIAHLCSQMVNLQLRTESSAGVFTHTWQLMQAFSGTSAGAIDQNTYI
jgi:hypothetical protein